jgi:hypothetical protein
MPVTSKAVELIAGFDTIYLTFTVNASHVTYISPGTLKDTGRGF